MARTRRAVVTVREFLVQEIFKPREVPLVIEGRIALELLDVAPSAGPGHADRAVLPICKVLRVP